MRTPVAYFIFIMAILLCQECWADTKVYVGSLSWNTTNDSLRMAFQDYGQILDAIVITDRETGRSRGFGFVTFATEQEAQAAISGMNEQELDGRKIRVNLANAKGFGKTR